MGYETRLIIGEKSGLFPNDPGKYVGVIATIDLCKSCFYDTYLDKEKDTERVFFYASDGETKIYKDDYDSYLFAINPKKVLAMMVEGNKVSKYRRYNAAIPLLRNIIKDFPGKQLTCILFGH